MSNMTNPMDALESLQFELSRGFTLKQCELHSDLKMIYDLADGVPRFTYVKIESGIIKSYAALILAEPLDGKTCFTIGYATPNKFQSLGLATEIVEKSIEELRFGLQRANVKEFHIEAVISVNNISSQKVANKSISKEREQITDEVSGEDAYYYKKLVV